LHATECPTSRDWLSTKEAGQADAFRFSKRRAEWTLGRLTAKRALAALLAVEEDELAELEIRSHPDGFPLPFRRGVPLPVTLSLSHRAGAALCAVQPGADPLGCDVELVERRSEAFVRDYLDADERARVDARPADRDWLVPLLWSAKESALKALRLGLSIDAREVGVRGLDDREGEGWRALCVAVRPATRMLPGFWCRRGRHVLTIVGAPNLAEPVALGEAADPV
jgi:4'-phosphopantetheinyl transferase